MVKRRSSHRKPVPCDAPKSSHYGKSEDAEILDAFKDVLESNNTKVEVYVPSVDDELRGITRKRR